MKLEWLVRSGHSTVINYAYNSDAVVVLWVAYTILLFKSRAASESISLVDTTTKI